LRKVSQPIVVLLCLSAVLLFPISSFGQSTNDTITAQDVISSLPLSQFKGISLLNSDFAITSPQPLGKFESSSMALMLATPPPAPRGENRKLPRFGVQFTSGTLGFGGQAATAVLRRANVRVGFNYFSYSLPTFNKDGSSYKGSLNLRSLEAEFDYYLFGGFHISPGGLLYSGNKVTANAFIPNGNTFTLGSTQYTASGNITGTGTLPLNNAAPMVKIGFGNLLPRNHRHFTFNFDIGAVFQQSPKVAINLVGTACPSGGGSCVNAATDPTVQANIQKEEAKINKDLKFFQYYPIISMGIGWKF
jgi:hypothetical protein